jgi:hypothetical protein
LILIIFSFLVEGGFDVSSAVSALEQKIAINDLESEPPFYGADPRYFECTVESEIFLDSDESIFSFFITSRCRTIFVPSRSAITCGLLDCSHSNSKIS